MSTTVVLIFSAIVNIFLIVVIVKLRKEVDEVYQAYAKDMKDHLKFMEDEVVPMQYQLAYLKKHVYTEDIKDLLN